MPNNPLPTPTPPKPLPASGPVPQGSAPKLAPTAAPQPAAAKPGAAVAGGVTPAPVSTPTPAPIKNPVVPPGQIKPPAVAPLKPPQPPQVAGVPAPAGAPQPAAAKPGTPVAGGAAPAPGNLAQPVPSAKPAVAQPAAVPPKPVTPGQAAAPVPTAPTVKPAAAPTNPAVKPPTNQPPAANAIAAPKPATATAAAAATIAKPALSVAPQPGQPTLAAKPGAPVAGGVAPAPGNPAQPTGQIKPVAPAPAPSGLPKPGVAPAAGSSAPVSPAPTGKPTPAQPAAGQPAAQVKSVKKPPFVLFAAIGLVLLAAIGFGVYSFFFKSTPSQSVSVADPQDNKTGTTGTNNQAGKTTGTNTATKPAGKQTTITYWGLWEPTEVLTQVIKDFETANPQYKIDYRKQSHRDYRERLQTAIASGNGPDVFRFHATWTPMLQDELQPMPLSVMSETDYKSTFYPVAAKQLSVGGKIVGIPLMYDGLALFYNKDILKTADAEPPQTWAELRSLADSLTVPSDKNMRGNTPIQRAGMAIGNTSNVEHFADILGLLILQNGGDLSSPNSPEVRDALLFYTNFLKEDVVWSADLPSSTVAFARGDVAMMLAPSWRVHDIKNLNANLNFGIAPAPKLGDTRLGWATYWAEGVNAKSKNQEGAWAFLKYLSSAEVMKKFYADASTVRSFGEIYSRQDLAKELSGDEITSQFLVDAPTADSWYLSSFTHDNGINDQLIKYYSDAINGILQGKTIDEVLQTVDAGTTQVLKQYNAE